MADEDHRALLNELIKSQNIRISLPLILHQTNNSMAAILAGLRMLRRNGADDKNADLLNEIFIATTDGATFVNKLSERTAVVQGPIEKIHLPTLISDVIRFVDGRYSQAPEFRKTINNEGVVLGNRRQLFQMLIHLLDNAVEASTDLHEPIEITLSDDPDSKEQRCVCLTVTDHGCGMEHAQLQTCKDPLVTSKPNHLGLGLTTVSTILEYHHGKMSIQTEPNQGTSMSFTIPYAMV